MVNRKITREEAIKIIYIMDVINSYDIVVANDHLEYFSHCEKNSEDFDFDEAQIDKNYLFKTLNDAINNLELIDNKIKDNAKGWKLKRIAKVDLAILRIALSEILFNEEIPNGVSINEAVDIGKKYSTDDAHKFINGILGTIFRGL